MPGLMPAINPFGECLECGEELAYCEDHDVWVCPIHAYNEHADCM